MDFSQVQQQATNSLAVLKTQVERRMLELNEQEDRLKPLAIADPESYRERYVDILVRLEIGQRLLAVDQLSVDTVLPLAIAHVESLNS